MNCTACFTAQLTINANANTPIIDPAAMNGVGGVAPEKMFEILYRNGAFWSILMITAALLIIKNTRTETLKYRKI